MRTQPCSGAQMPDGQRALWCPHHAKSEEDTVTLGKCRQTDTDVHWINASRPWLRAYVRVRDQ
eukprot:1101342-Lingulodinium_polyedra.AAC.1